MSIKIIKGGITAPKGFLAAGISCGIKKLNRKKDLGLIYSQVPAISSTLFTKNKIKAAPIEVTRKNLRGGFCQALVVNSGNANCATGINSLRNAQEMVTLVAEGLGIKPSQVAVASTGIIGVPLPMEKIKRGIKSLVKEIHQKGSSHFAEAIITTDTFSKEISIKIKIKDKDVCLAGVAKGAGMIFPNLATMLCFLTTDAKVEKNFLKMALKKAIDESFNLITVDGETSTNDMVLMMANGLAGNIELKEKTKEAKIFQEGLNFVTSHLSKLIVKDGEGATKLIEIKVKGASSKESAKKIALSVANSNLVKCAFFGEDPNWGRILSAIGNANVPINSQKIDISYENIKIVKNGSAVKYSGKEIKKIMKKPEIKIVIDLKMGKNQVRVWTTDLSYDYVKINAAYRT